VARTAAHRNPAAVAADFDQNWFLWAGGIAHGNVTRCETLFGDGREEVNNARIGDLAGQIDAEYLLDVAKMPRI